MEELPFNLPKPRELDPLPKFDPVNPDYGHQEAYGDTTQPKVLEGVEVPTSSGTPEKDFVIREDSVGDVIVSGGTLIQSEIYNDGQGSPAQAIGSFPVSVSSHSFTPTGSTTYGIWIKIQRALRTEGRGSGTPDIGEIATWNYSTATIYETNNSSFNDYTKVDALIASHTSGTFYHYLWIGSVQVSAGTITAINQDYDAYGPFFLPLLSFTDGILSGDTGNKIIAGTDNGVFLNITETGSSGITLTTSTPGVVDIANAGVLSIANGGSITVSSSTGAVTLTNAGVTSLTDNNSSLTLSATTGDITIND